MMEHWREKKNEKIQKKLEDQRKQAEDQAMRSISNYTSTRAILKKSVPMIMLGLVLAAVEYMLIGAIYTIVSLLIYIPVLLYPVLEPLEQPYAVLCVYFIHIPSSPPSVYVRSSGISRPSLWYCLASAPSHEKRSS